jgi:CubicO group peptidase (beta-lactamase class C family)
LQLELEHTLKQPLYDFLKNGLYKNHSHLPLYWRDLPLRSFIFPKTGERLRTNIQGQVHDDNAFYLPNFCAHAGLFSSVQRLLSILLFLENEYSFIKTIQEHIKQKGSRSSQQHRFVNGFDTVTDSLHTSAGEGYSLLSFGHLGFTGTSLWIDPEKKRGHLLLTNATEKSWYPRHHLATLRKFLGTYALQLDISRPNHL